jgi:tRNA(Ile)-lysidine synthase
MKIFHEFKNVLQKHHLLEKNDSVIVGVSGGSDSVALLHLLQEVAEKFPLKIIIAHVNYHTRGKDSEADAKLTEKYAKQLGLIYEVQNVRVSKKGNFEDLARYARYGFFERMRKKHQAQAIAVAHTKDDQAETILMHFIKGSGLNGLASMREKEGNIIRPVLNFTKQELRDYLRAHKITFREDKTNKDTTFTRNKIRHELLPELQKYNPNIIETLNRNARIFSELENYLQLLAASYYHKNAKLSNQIISVNAASFETLPRPVAREVLHLALKKLDHKEPLSAEHFEQVYKVMLSPVSRKTKEISKHLKVTRLHDVILIERHR